MGKLYISDMGKIDNKTVGERGEKLAREHLQILGYTIIGKNYRTKWGEIDIIAKDKDIVVFVEVKTKTNNTYGEPWEMVNQWKIEQVKRMGEVWCRDFGWKGLIRMDVVGIILGDGDEPKIDYYENV